MDEAIVSPPKHILGYTIRSRTRIYVSYIIPCVCELIVYIVQMVTDVALSYQLFKTQQPGFAGATLTLILLPAFFTFILVLTSKDHWTNPKNDNHLKYFGVQFLQFLLFPFFVIYRFLVRQFWSIEALFHDDDDTERMDCLARAEECSTCELYLLIQAYAQAAPQIILQLYHLLQQDLFRDFETSSLQAISLVFSAIDLAAITTSYQRFESQHRVGRAYPWSTPQKLEAQRELLQKHKMLCDEVEQKKRDSERTIASFPESDKIMANFRQKNSAESSPQAVSDDVRTHEQHFQSLDEVDNDAQEETTVLMHSQHTHPVSHNATDDDKIQIKPKPQLTLMSEVMRNADRIEVLDTVPDTPPPLPPPNPPPPSASAPPTQLPPNTTMPQLRRGISMNSDTMRSKRYTRPLSQLETFKDMLIVNAQLYIKEHVPRPPKLLITRVDEQPHEEQTPLVAAQTPLPTTPQTPPQDVVDFFLPRPTKIVNGIEQDDFAGKTVAFFGWIAFITMRMLSLATFCSFYPKAFFIIIGVHYLLMLAGLCLETRFRGKLNKSLFYLLLAYIYIFVLLEFRIRFKHIRVWFILYMLVTMVENITMSAIWYANEEYESWWYGFIWEWIIYSGILLLATLIVYYCLLKPKEVNILVENETETNQKTQTPTTA